MFGLSATELLIIAVLALILLGPDKLPDAAKTVAKGLKEIKKATDEIKGQIETELYTTVNDIKTAVDPTRPALVPPVAAAPITTTAAPTGPAPEATAENVPGLEAALVEAEPAAPAAPDTPPAPHS